MDFELLELLFIRMNKYLVGHPLETITFTWHGGEVCLLGSDYFNTAIRLQEKHCPDTRSRINHQVQSNLTLINQDIIDAFKGWKNQPDILNRAGGISNITWIFIKTNKPK